MCVSVCVSFGIIEGITGKIYKVFIYHCYMYTIHIINRSVIIGMSYPEQPVTVMRLREEAQATVL